MHLTRLPAPVLIIGAAHSGKSELAIQALAPDQEAVVVGTGVIEEVTFKQRLEDLRSLRPASWNLIETNRDIPAVLAQCLSQNPPPAQILVDALNQWLAAAIVEQEGTPEEITRQIIELEKLVLATRHQRLILVTSEVGAAAAPARAAERLFRKSMGELNQRLARACASVVLVTAGIPQLLKTE
jgi:adenosylcobinamide kinase/adenosylcobinamide-phosphate guanylyltransferase